MISATLAYSLTTIKSSLSLYVDLKLFMDWLMSTQDEAIGSRLSYCVLLSCKYDSSSSSEKSSDIFGDTTLLVWNWILRCWYYSGLDYWTVLRVLLGNRPLSLTFMILWWIFKLCAWSSRSSATSTSQQSSSVIITECLFYCFLIDSSFFSILWYF